MSHRQRLQGHSDRPAVRLRIPDKPNDIRCRILQTALRQLQSVRGITSVRNNLCKFINGTCNVGCIAFHRVGSTITVMGKNGTRNGIKCAKKYWTSYRQYAKMKLYCCTERQYEIHFWEGLYEKRNIRTDQRSSSGLHMYRLHQQPKTNPQDIRSKAKRRTAGISTRSQMMTERAKSSLTAQRQMTVHFRANGTASGMQLSARGLISANGKSPTVNTATLSVIMP